jgi:hypothetical protein
MRFGHPAKYEICADVTRYASNAANGLNVSDRFSETPSFNHIRLGAKILESRLEWSLFEENDNPFYFRCGGMLHKKMKKFFCAPSLIRHGHEG